MTSSPDRARATQTRVPGEFDSADVNIIDPYVPLWYAGLVSFANSYVLSVLYCSVNSYSYVLVGIPIAVSYV